MSGRGLLIMAVVACMFTSVITIGSIKDKSEIPIGNKVENVALLCLESVFPAVSRGSGFSGRDKITVATADTNPLDYLYSDSEGVEKIASDNPSVSRDAKSPKVENSDNPQVLIYHTHGTESYMPVDFGNFHTVEEFATVRDVGDFFTHELNQNGVTTYHDKAIHDSPSYSNAYDRSLESAKGLLAKFPQSTIIIDMHRDAAPYVGGGKTVKIDGQDVATYALVVGNGNENAVKLMAFAEKINAKAESMYPGFGGRIIPKDYKYNQYISDNALLLEVGNNQNSIEEARLSGEYLAKVITEVIKEI